MRKITIALAFLVATTFMVSCGDTGNAAKKINQTNLESAKSRDAEIKKGVASLSVEKREYDFGTVTEGEIVETTFKITNSGKTDLVITDAQVTCGCTVPVWPKAPIKPGETKDIEVKFNTNGKRNKQQKNITLVTNTQSGREILTLKGMVTPKAK
ncbi:DUF1573 domain-containing protein [uncultured Polaribacter sp.]|uniref:DUF1573 domain-containing protein n=1 Tax=uncultured Polaribacter sp. TaxID=174711 RepID=UPI002622566C|nr:DUF1573 domain-containing protein [uncultured Polaribacter sp.]